MYINGRGEKNPSPLLKSFEINDKEIKERAEYV